MKESGNNYKVETCEKAYSKFEWYKPVLSDLNIKNTFTGDGGHIVDGTVATGSAS